MNYNEFIEKVKTLANLPDEERADKATGIVFKLLGRRLTKGEAKDVESQLPKLLKENWAGSKFAETLIRAFEGQLTYSTKEELYDIVGKELAKQGIAVDPEEVVVAVFHTLKEQIDVGEQEDVASQLPRDIKKLWAEA